MADQPSVTRPCPACGTAHRDKRGRCRECAAAKERTRRRIHIEAHRARERARYGADPAKILTRQAARKAADPKGHKARAHARYVAHRSEYLERKAARKAADPEGFRAKERARRAANLANYRAKERGREQARFAADPEKIRAQKRTSNAKWRHARHNGKAKSNSRYYKNHAERIMENERSRQRRRRAQIANARMIVRLKGAKNDKG